MGTPGVWNKETGAGFGVIYSTKKQVEKGDAYFTLAANYVADAGEGNNSNPTEGGFLTDNSRGNVTTQIAYGNNSGVWPLVTAMASVVLASVPELNLPLPVTSARIVKPMESDRG